MSYRNILPGSTIGILGGGQLGRMMALAGKAMGYCFVTLDPSHNCSCSQVADDHIIAEYKDTKGANLLADKSQVITYEFENVDAEVVENLEKLSYVPQGSILLKITQNRIMEKRALQSFGLPVAPFEIINRDPFEMVNVDTTSHLKLVATSAITRMEAILMKAIDTLGLPLIMKTATGGYDGKGQWIIRNERDYLTASQVFSQPEYADIDFIVEKFIDFEREISVVVARNCRGEIETFPVAENKHVNNILHMSIVPAHIPAAAEQHARQIAVDIAEQLGLLGVLAVEMFYQADGNIYINELAPRPHNSGHYTMDACETSQFEQHVRAICNLPLGNTTLLTPVVMVNLLGQHIQPFTELLPELPKQVKFHLYGKQGAVHNRKMGHINVVAEDVKQALVIIATKLSFIEELL